MIVVLRKKRLWIIPALLLMIALSVGTGVAIASSSPKPVKIVVLDAGHGGIDGGVCGINSKTPEAVINLQIALRLKNLLEAQSFRVVMTRSDENGLYEKDAPNKKRSDMEARKNIILSAKPDLVLSIHCNRFPSSDRRGAQVFFDRASSSGCALASSLQSALNTANHDAGLSSFSPLHGDYYLLKCSPYPSAIAECGFLSNPEDDALLNDASHREKIAYCLFSGILGFFATEESTT